MTINATLTCQFGVGVDAADGHLSAEFDSRPTGLNAGKTSWTPGETAYFLVYQSDNVTHSTPVASAGSIVSATAGTVEREEDVTFADTDTAQLSVPSSGIVSVTWLGNSLGSLTLSADKLTLTASAKGVAVARVKYNATPAAYGLVSPTEIAGLTSFSIVVLIVGQLTS